MPKKTPAKSKATASKPATTAATRKRGPYKQPVIELTPAELKAVQANLAGYIPQTLGLKPQLGMTTPITFRTVQLKHLEQQLVIAAKYAKERDQEPLWSVSRKIGDLLDSKLPKSQQARAILPPESEPGAPLQFLITLRGVHPPIWRRIQLQDGPLAHLHDCIQAAFGWEEAHPHVFDINHLDYGQERGQDVWDEWEVLLSELVLDYRPRLPWTYEYDMGDSWIHDIVCEGYQPLSDTQYPVCLEGERAGPPEDIGGIYGYYELLDLVKKKGTKSEEEDWLQELAADFDPDHFDATSASQKMREYLRKEHPPSKGDEDLDDDCEDSEFEDDEAEGDVES